MDKTVKKIIEVLFYLLFSSVPLVLFPKTSEIFEFNKMVFTYFITTSITGLWLIRMVVNKRIIFKKTLLDIPLLIFLASQILSTVFSVDIRTSIFGYYSRFHGGLLSTISYSILYWAYVANMAQKETVKSVGFIFLSTFITSIWAILEHFGHSFSCFIFPGFRTFDVSCWVQDVQNRVYSTFGQPNWLAAWLVAIIPTTWAYSMLNAKSQMLNRRVYNLSFNFLAFVFFITLLFTKSRSAILAFAGSSFVFWGFSTLKVIRTRTAEAKAFIKKLLIFNFTFLIVALATGTPWTPSFKSLLSSPTTNNQQTTTVSGPALETGGTESGKIRKIVWAGAADIWRHYPVFGSGVETFAYSYYQYKPQEHNLVSEWDYLYNKAHNEYLNYAATTGSIGLLAYLFLICTSFLIFLKFQFSNSNFQTTSNLEIKNWKFVNWALVSGYTAILITNFFGFSVVPVAILFFLFPAMAICLGKSDEGKVVSTEKLDVSQKTLAVIILLLTSYVLLLISNYWYSDYLYAKGKLEYDSGNYQESLETLTDLTRKSPNEALYWDELSEVSNIFALSYLKEGGVEEAKSFSQAAVTQSSKAVFLSPANVNFKRKLASQLVGLSEIDPNYLLQAQLILEEALIQAPTDPKLYYNLSYAHLRTGNYEKAIRYMEKAIILKPDYEKARYALALMYEDVKEEKKAKDELKYILENINPQNLEAKRELDELGN